MKIANKLSLRMRITLLAGGILVLCSIILTGAAFYNAYTLFYKLTAAEVVLPPNAPQSAGIGDVPIDTARSTVLAAKAHFDHVGLSTLAAVSILGMVMIYTVAGRSLLPIHRLSKTISTITEANLKKRIAEEGRKDEVGALGHSFNVMLDRLERSFVRQKQFSANAAHELKTPLATINAGIQVLRLDEAPTVADYEETLTTVERNVKRLMAVVDDLLTLYDEQDEGSIDAVNLKEMFETICGELRFRFEEKQLEVDLHCELQTVQANPVLLYRACFNLVENAAKYNKDGGRIWIKTFAEDRGGKIVIYDTGRGIPASELQSIFDPFHRVNKSRSRKEGGAGLGLSIVKSIVEKHGWRVSVESVPEQGSTFTIMF